MTTTARSIIERAQVLLQDPDGVRWTAGELVNWLNDAQRELVRIRPDANVKTVEMSLAAGYRQLIPTDALNLIDIPANATGKFKRVTKIDMFQLDAVAPGWRSKTPSDEILHFMHDMREPLIFHVYPPATTAAKLLVIYSTIPNEVAAPSGQASSTVSGNIDVQDQWSDALLNFVMSKAYSKDAEFGGNVTLASGYYAQFKSAIGEQLQSAASVAPKT